MSGSSIASLVLDVGGGGLVLTKKEGSVRGAAKIRKSAAWRSRKGGPRPLDPLAMPLMSGIVKQLKIVSIERS